LGHEESCIIKFHYGLSHTRSKFYCKNTMSVERNKNKTPCSPDAAACNLAASDASFREYPSPCSPEEYPPLQKFSGSSAASTCKLTAVVKTPDVDPDLNSSAIPHQTNHLNTNQNSQSQNKFDKFLIIKSNDNSKEMSKVSPFKVERAIIEASGKRTGYKIKPLQSGLLLIEVDQKEIHDKLKNIKQVDSIPVTVESHSTLNFLKVPFAVIVLIIIPMRIYD